MSRRRPRWPGRSCLARAGGRLRRVHRHVQRHLRQAQAEVDAQLTNGADVTVTEPPGAVVRRRGRNQLAAIPGVRAVEPIQHRFAYIGADLQDLYGVNPASITAVTALQDSYFHRRHRRTTCCTPWPPNPIRFWFSAETVKISNSCPATPSTCACPTPAPTNWPPSPFHYIGIVTEFPTAPKDSFFVANAAYVAQHTGTDAVGAFLVDTGGQDTTAVANRIRALSSAPRRPSPISPPPGGTIGSSLTAVDLAGLTRVELGIRDSSWPPPPARLVLALGLAERRRSFAIATALGATRRQLRSFVLAEAAILIACGLTAGAVLGATLSRMLVSVLTGVFDPPPTTLTTPAIYLTATALTGIVAIGAVSAATVRLAHRSPLTLLGEL